MWNNSVNKSAIETGGDVGKFLLALPYPEKRHEAEKGNCRDKYNSRGCEAESGVRIEVIRIHSDIDCDSSSD